MQIECTVLNVIFTNADNGYTVLAIDADGVLMTAVGIFPNITEGERLKLNGEIINHPKFGEQFKVESYEFIQHSNLEDLRRYLGAGLFRGIGEVLADRIVAAFGHNAFEVIEKDYERLSEVKGVSKAKAKTIHEEFMGQIAMRDSLIFLQKLGIGTSTAIKIYNVYTKDTIDVVSQNPFQLIQDVDGIGFGRADNIAEKMGIGKDSEFRMRAGVIHVLKESEKMGGHTCLAEDLLVEEASSLLATDDKDAVRDAICVLLYSGYFVRFKREGEGEEENLIALSKNFNLENSIAASLIKRLAVAKPLALDVEKDIKIYEKQKSITLHEGQKAAIKSAIDNGIAVVSGGPGTGKTTIINCIVSLLDNNGQKVALAAPTGRAAKRLSEASKQEAKTLHRLLGVHFENGKLSFSFNERNKIDVDAIIIDEISMADIYIFNSLLKAMNPETRLILVGDYDQLPSVSAGNILSDIIQSGLVPVNYLTYVYRQSDKSLIISNAHLINRREMPVLDNNSDDFYFFETSDKLVQEETIVSLVKERLPNFKKIPSADIQVLAPSKKGVAGVESLNKALQNALNHNSKSYVDRDVIYRVGDKVMHIRNNYEKEWERFGAYREKGVGVFNGDMGTITAIGASIEVTFEDGRLVKYEKGDTEELMLAYAVSVHKSQGSEFAAVIISLTGGSPMLITRNLLYTAVTRAKKVVVLVGDKKTVYRMVKNDYTEKRYTLLKYLLIKNQKKMELLK